MSRGVATKRRRSRHQSRIHREDAGAGRTADTDPEGTAGCINARDFLRFGRPIGCFVALAGTLFLLCFFEPANGRSSSNHCTKSSPKKVRGKRDYFFLLPLNISCNCLPELESPAGQAFKPDLRERPGFESGRRGRHSENQENAERPTLPKRRSEIYL